MSSHEVTSVGGERRGPFDLSGRVAVITGGGTGLGKGIAIGLAQAGATVILVGRRGDVLDAAVAEVRTFGGQAEAAPFDVTRTSALPAFFESVMHRHGQLDVLVTSAGTNRRNTSLDYAEEEWDAVMELNLKAVFFCCQAAARIMKTLGRGKIINVASTASTMTMINQAAYAPSKGAVKLLTRQLAFELAPHGINVNAIGPGWFRTALNERLFQDAAWRRGVEARIPMGRTGAAEDLAGAAVFLASDASDYVTGQILYVDGGLLSGYAVAPVGDDAM